MDSYKIFKNKHGELRAILAKDESGIDNIENSMMQNSDLSESKIDKLIEYLKEKDLKVGFVASLEVYEESKGKGKGKEFMDTFKEEIMKETDVDILLARTRNKQNKGFNLEEFYEKYGFKGIALEYGDLLMVSKGFDIVLEKELGLIEEREMIQEFYKKNEPKSREEIEILNFIKKKEKKEKNNYKI